MQKGLISEGFTLSELLIALAILGVIATFTIPKVLQNQADTKYKSLAKESAGMVSEAYQILRQKGQPSTSVTLGDIAPYLNYVNRDTASQVDDRQLLGTYDCSGWPGCLRLHNGAMLVYNPGESFGGISTLHALWFVVDPDGKVTDGTTNGPGKGVAFWLYYNGRVTSREYILPGTINSSGSPYNPVVGADPPWFSWN